jgi:hypothetical protein
VGLLLTLEASLMSGAALASTQKPAAVARAGCRDTIFERAWRLDVVTDNVKQTSCGRERRYRTVSS